MALKTVLAQKPFHVIDGDRSPQSRTSLALVERLRRAPAHRAFHVGRSEYWRVEPNLAGKDPASQRSVWMHVSPGLWHALKVETDRLSASRALNLMLCSAFPKRLCEEVFHVQDSGSN